MFPQAHIPAGKTVLHLYTVHLGLSIVSQSPARTFLGCLQWCTLEFGSGCNLNKVWWHGNHRSGTPLAGGGPLATSLHGLTPGLYLCCKAQEPGRAKWAAAGLWGGKENSISSFSSSFWRGVGLCYYLINSIIAFFNQHLTSSLADMSCPRVISGYHYLQSLRSWLSCSICILLECSWSLLGAEHHTLAACHVPQTPGSRMEGAAATAPALWRLLYWALPWSNRNPL